MLRTAALLSFIFVFSGRPAPQEWQQISPQAAESHLLKKAKPIYPPFAKAAGIEGEVRLQVGIYTDGRIHSIGIEGGPPALVEAAKQAVLKYVYQPFDKAGQPVNVETTVAVAFKLAERRSVERSYPPPSVAELSFSLRRSAKPAENLPVLVQQRADEDLGKKRASFYCELSTSPSGRTVVQVPAQGGLFLVFYYGACMCGASGNCPVEVVELDQQGVHVVLDSWAGEVALRQRKNVPVPDLFFISHMSAEYAGIAGFVKVDGLWGQLYCGTLYSQATQKSEIHVCRKRGHRA